MDDQRIARLTEELGDLDLAERLVHVRRELVQVVPDHVAYRHQLAILATSAAGMPSAERPPPSGSFRASSRAGSVVHDRHDGRVVLPLRRRDTVADTIGRVAMLTAAASVAALAAVGGLAVGGALPAAAQDLVADLASTVGFEVPRSDRAELADQPPGRVPASERPGAIPGSSTHGGGPRGDTPGANRRSADTPGQDARDTNPGANRRSAIPAGETRDADGKGDRSDAPAGGASEQAPPTPPPSEAETDAGSGSTPTAPTPPTVSARDPGPPADAGKSSDNVPLERPDPGAASPRDD